MKPKKSHAGRNGNISVDALIAKAEATGKLAKAAKKHMKLLKLEHRQAKKAYKQARKAAKRARNEAEAAIKATKGNGKAVKTKPIRNRAAVRPKRAHSTPASTIEPLPLGAMAPVSNGVRPSA